MLVNKPSQLNNKQNNHGLRIAIVEDNTTARMNLRSHLLEISQFDIASYSNGKELRNGLRLNNIDIVFMDYHLGQNKDGVEWILQLQEVGLLQPATGIVFVTSDSLPQTIGKILDVHPDFILIKPYTIKNLRLNVAHYLSLRHELMPILNFMNQNKFDLALKELERKEAGKVNPRFKNDYLKLKGRLLLITKQYEASSALYSSVLESSSNVLWAHWGLIKSEFLIGKWQQCRTMLNQLLAQSITKDKANEWLASVAIGSEHYEEAEVILDNINDNELSIQATRLKILSYQMQEKYEEAKQLLNKKIQSNLTVKERFSDYAVELARLHIHIAENLKHEGHSESVRRVNAEKSENLSEARKLIGRTARIGNDRQAELQQDYMLALALLLDGEQEKAQRIVQKNDSIETLSKAKINTLVDAVKVWMGIGEVDSAKALLKHCDDAIKASSNHIEHLICNERITELEQEYNMQKERAISTNEQGMMLYRDNQLIDAMSCFVKAYKMYRGVPAFSLNLLQCMADLEQDEYKGLEAPVLFSELNGLSLSKENQIKLEHIKVTFGF